MLNLECTFKQDTTYEHRCALTDLPTCYECQYYVTGISSEYIMCFCVFRDSRIPRDIYRSRGGY